MFRKSPFVSMVSIALFAAAAAWADVPQTINHQGLVTVNGTRFTGTGQFKFAILDGSGVNLWTNDDSNLVLNGVPNTHEDVPVQDGIYSVLLGGSDNENYTMTPIPPSIFKVSGTKLRIFFSDGEIGFQALTPDHPLAASPYAHQTAFQPPVGSIMAWHKSFANTPALADGWVECNGQTLADSKSPYNGQVIPDLNGEGRFLRGGTLSGTPQDDRLEDHAHGPPVPADNFTVVKENCGNQGIPGGTGNQCFLLGGTTGSAVTSGVVGTETRPINMSVVWIMRVK